MRLGIVGAGASGLVAAIVAAAGGAEVVVLEQAEKIGKKLYATGNGRCNLTNQKMGAEFFRGNEMQLVQSALHRFGVAQTLEFFQDIGLHVHEKNGYVYPSSNQAASVVMVLEKRCRELGVKLLCNTTVQKVKKSKKGFVLTCTERIKKDKKQIEERNVLLSADKVILAAGTRAGGFGCETDGCKLAAGFGHRIIPVVPALTGMYCEAGNFFRKTAGVRCQGNISLWEMNRQTGTGKKEQDLEREGTLLCEDEGELQLTDYGISGIPAFQVSRYAAYARLEGRNVIACVDFLPEISEKELLGFLKEYAQKYPSRSIWEILSGLYPSKLAEGILMYGGWKPDTKAAVFAKNKTDFLQLCRYLKHFEAQVTRVNNIKNAQVCAGGVSLSEIDENFMSKKMEHLYITGEMLDVDGICGGYNLQFAWSSGYLAGKAALGKNPD